MQLPGNRVQLLPLWLREIKYEKNAKIKYLTTGWGECYTAIV